MSERVEALVRELVDALKAETSPPATAPPRLLSIPEAAGVLGVGRTLVYTEMGRGRLRSLKCGRRRLIPEAAIGEYIAQADK